MRVCILILLLMQGCGGSVDSNFISKVIELCEPNGGIEKLTILDGANVTCNNGATFRGSDI